MQFSEFILKEAELKSAYVDLADKMVKFMQNFGYKGVTAACGTAVVYTQAQDHKTQSIVPEKGGLQFTTIVNWGEDTTGKPGGLRIRILSAEDGKYLKVQQKGSKQAEADAPRVTEYLQGEINLFDVKIVE